MVQQQVSRLQRIYEEVLALSRYFGRIDWDDEDGRWVLIYQLRLPSQYKKKRFTACLLICHRLTQKPNPMVPMLTQT
jgi:hypothetical protein